MNTRARNLVVALAIAAVFAFSLERLFEYRFAAGDVYPPGSSLRADPLGAKALHEALGRLPGLRVSRRHEPLAQARPLPDTTLLVLGLDPSGAARPMPTPEDDRALEQQVRDGARLVVAFRHESSEAATNFWARGRRQFRAGLRGGTNRVQDLDQRLGFTLVATNAPGDTAQRVADGPGLPAEMPWKSAWALAGLGTPWRTVYARGGQPVVAERPLGAGTVVVVASDYLFSNAALRHGRESGFLAWCVGANRHVVFEETHLGLTVEPGIASLVRKYRLGGAVAGLLVLAVLYAWRQGARFNPPPDGPESDVVEGHGSAGGLLNVLRRSVPPASLPEVAFEEWRRSLGRHHAVAPARIADAQEAINLERAKPPRQRDPAAFHRRITEILRRR